MFIGAGLQTAMFGALWYAPLLVAWRGIPAGKAVFFSVAAALINWRAFLVFGLIVRWAWRPANRSRFESDSRIPLNDEG